MTRQQLIEELAKQEAVKFYGQPASRSIQGEFFRHIQELLHILSPLIPEWRRVDEYDTPPELVDLLVYIEEQDHIAAAVYEKSEGFYENYENVKIENVTHWMLMPVKKPGTDPLQSLIK